MKLLPIAFALVLGSPALAQGSPPSGSELPGQQFSLPGALELFKRNIEMERFEQELNTDSTHVNNLDLDGDGLVDFLRVVVLPREGDAVAIVIRALVGANEQQDVAVILVGKTGEAEAMVQIHGDESLYPAATFIEPLDEQDLEGSSASAANAWSWRPVPWCFSARFYAYVSPWGAKEKPQWWQAVPVRTGTVSAERAPVPGYRPWKFCRVAQALTFYAPQRSWSASVVRHTTAPAKKEP